MEKMQGPASFTDIIWMNILTGDPLLEFLKESGFIIKGNAQTIPFGLPSYIIEMQVSKNQ
ncbi:hypothetical protein [Chryseobacterium bernardetii]|uniref:hypothetical protein n=1 Tax=Chryseobacterium bernardetii TaxID=1241978 RepID=UPI00301650F9